MTDEHVAHGNLHPGDRWQPWTRGPSAARAMIRRMQRLTRQQRDREEISLGYRDLGGEGGIS